MKINAIYLQFGVFSMSILFYLPADTSIDQAEHNKEVKVYDKGSFDMARICII